MPYKVAGDYDQGKGLMSVNTQSEFSRQIIELFGRIRPKKIIETGTFLGAGTTAIIGAALRHHKIECPEFYSIEINPQFFAAAHSNVQKLNINVQLLHGLSVPRAMLPTRDDIRREYVHKVQDGVFVDWPEDVRADSYYRETDFAGPDDLLGSCLARFNGAPDFVLLDSGGHMGYLEFTYLVERLRGPCHLALDDIKHVKHHRSLAAMKADPRFNVLVESDEKFGFCIARFDPGSGNTRQ